jgi:ABC-type dipeptide/oligopeptide/nickel transport system permease subunit
VSHEMPTSRVAVVTLIPPPSRTRIEIMRVSSVPPVMTRASASGRRESTFAGRERSGLHQSARRFLRHRLAVGGLAIFLLLVAFAFVGPLLWRYSFMTLTPDVSQGPGLAHPFGTDSIGHDMLAEVMSGLQESTRVALLIGLAAASLGTPWGLLSGYRRGLLDASLMRIADMLIPIPQLAVAAALANHFGGTWWILGIVLGGMSAPYQARVVRGVVMSLREREFVEAARALGASHTRIMLVHLMPNAMGVVILNTTLLAGAGVLGETALSFFGFGIRPPETSLGLLVAEGQGAIFTRPWLFYFPGLLVMLFALTVYLIGDGLRDALDPQQQARRHR